MRAFTVLVPLVVAVLAATSACSTDGGVDAVDAADAADAETPTVTAARQPHTSSDLGYEVQVPPEWSVTEASLPWELGAAPRRRMPMADSFVSAAEDPWFLVASQLVGPGVSLEDWTSQLRETETITYPRLCDAPEWEADTRLGGEPAHMVALACPRDFPRAVGLQILAVHDGRGYYVLCYSEERAQGDHETLESECGRWLESFAFL